MNQTLHFILLGLALALVLGVLLSPFASSHPDGLEKVAENQGFIHAAEETPPAWEHSPIPDYEAPLVRHDAFATGVAGLVGVLMTFAVAYVAGKLLAARKSGDA